MDTIERLTRDLGNNAQLSVEGAIESMKSYATTENAKTGGLLMGLMFATYANTRMYKPTNYKLIDIPFSLGFNALRFTINSLAAFALFGEKSDPTLAYIGLAIETITILGRVLAQYCACKTEDKADSVYSNSTREENNPTESFDDGDFGPIPPAPPLRTSQERFTEEALQNALQKRKKNRGQNYIENLNKLGEPQFNRRGKIRRNDTFNQELFNRIKQRRAQITGEN